jgi:hypothetical protein
VLTGWGFVVAACLLFVGVALLVHAIFNMTDRRDDPSNRDGRRKNRR